MSSTDDSSNDSPPQVDPQKTPPPTSDDPPPTKPGPVPDNEDIWGRINREKRRLESGYLELGRDLYVVFSRGLYKDAGFPTFDDWCRAEGIEPGKARRLRRVFKAFQRDLNLPLSKVAEVGYSNACLIMPVINASNADDWIAKAKTLKHLELKKLVDQVRPKKRRVVVEAPGDQPQFYTPNAKLASELVDEKHRPSTDGQTVSPEEVVYEKTFYLVGEQVRVLETTLEVMERRTGSSKMGYLLTSALLEFLAKGVSSETKEDGQIAYFMALLEQRYGGRVLWIKDKKVAEKLRELIGQAEGQEVAPPGS